MRLPKFRYVEPKSIKEWLNIENINLYVATQYVRPWHVDGKYSEAAAYYLTMEAGSFLAFHMLNRKIDLIKSRKN